MGAPSPPEDNHECRLCFEGGEGLIAPCECAGTTKWVHRACLNQWRYHGQTTNRKSMIECPTCHYQYQLYVNFDTGDQTERRRKLRGRVAARFGGGFAILLALSAGVGVVLSLLDKNGSLVRMVGGVNDKVLHHDHPIAGFFKQHLFLYWSAGLLLTFFIIGVGTLLFLALAPCCGCSSRADEVARRIPAPGVGSCCDDCCSACTYNYACDPMGGMYCADCESLVACEGDAALVCVGLVIIALIVFGIFIAIVVMAGAVKKAGENYVRILYLKDVAEHFAVVDRSCEGSSVNSTCPPSMQNMNSNSVPFGEAASNLSQAEIHQMLEAELSTARVGAGPDEGDEENSQGGAQARDVVLRR